jgi:hypothetical protein
MTSIAANPYETILGARDPIAVLSETSTELARLTADWLTDDFDRAWEPGKWTARHILLHLAQTELMFGQRARIAVNGDATEVQTYDQDRWVTREIEGMRARDALAVFVALRLMNVALFRSLTPEDLAVQLRHPERGTIDVEWLVCTLAGHDLHHLSQLHSIGGQVAP